MEAYFDGGHLHNDTAVGSYLSLECFSYNSPDEAAAAAVGDFVVGSIDDGDYVDFEEAYNGTYIESLIFSAEEGAYHLYMA